MLSSDIIMLPSAECVLPLHALYSKLTIRIARTPFNNYIWVYNRTVATDGYYNPINTLLLV